MYWSVILERSEGSQGGGRKCKVHTPQILHFVQNDNFVTPSEKCRVLSPQRGEKNSPLPT